MLVLLGILAFFYELEKQDFPNVNYSSVCLTITTKAYPSLHFLNYLHDEAIKQVGHKS